MTTPAVTHPALPTSEDLRSVIDELMRAFSTLPDEAWDTPAHESDWTCREAASHVVDTMGFYAMQISGTGPFRESYVQLVDRTDSREGAPPVVFWPDPGTGTRGIVGCLDAVGGMLVAVAATAPPERRGWHPYGTSDSTGFAAMGITESLAHGHDILAAQGVDLTPDAAVCRRVLDRIFPAATRTDDPWHDLLVATGRTPETRGQRWRWDSSVR
ncbi:MAG TPA: maleylpyruvate isomerase N-terminal domain-containing protein [Pedococcus sp.]|jgi:hypothetical protein|uniref:maleylpyruvate isomerase N-terminal domain-containing protein n=1 Tax=Pedococcus sp. TaxID=2860345 RepID=UPI002F944991